MSTFLHPGHFVDIEIPVFRGQPLLVARNDVEYEFYLNWLADHLYQDKPTEQDETPAKLWSVNWLPVMFSLSLMY